MSLRARLVRDERIAQDVALFNDSLYANIAFARPGAGLHPYQVSASPM